MADIPAPVYFVPGTLDECRTEIIRLSTMVERITKENTRLLDANTRIENGNQKIRKETQEAQNKYALMHSGRVEAERKLKRLRKVLRVLSKGDL